MWLPQVYTTQQVNVREACEPFGPWGQLFVLVLSRSFASDLGPSDSTAAAFISSFILAAFNRSKNNTT